MVIAVLQHGLGNQLFQYAVGRALADRQKTTLLLDATHFAYLTDRAPDLMKLRPRARLLPGRAARLLAPGGSPAFFKRKVKTWLARCVPTRTDRQLGYDAAVLDERRSCRLDGFWQSERYFARLRLELIEDCEPAQALPAPLAEFSRRVAGEESIAVHVRRGDLVTDPHYAASVGALGPAYYREALARMKAWFPGARVYLFSDDPAWCERNIPAALPTEVVSGKMTRSAVEDLTVMKRCRHFVVANSTFSWWAAWLGVHPLKRVIAPARFFRTPREWEKDLLPAGWETLEPAFQDA